MVENVTVLFRRLGTLNNIRCYYYKYDYCYYINKSSCKCNNGILRFERQVKDFYLIYLTSMYDSL